MHLKSTTPRNRKRRTVNCARCGKPFEQFVAKKASIYCSRDCRFPVAVRFWAKVRKSSDPNGCWEWTGCKMLNGYGLFGRGGVGNNTGAHRMSFELAYGPIPDGHVVMHSCDNPSCVNPAHLSSGTLTDNAHDAIRKGRWKNELRHKPGETNGNAILTEEKVRAIRLRYALGGVTQKQLAAEYGVSNGLINFVITRRAWKHVE